MLKKCSAEEQQQEKQKIGEEERGEGIEEEGEGGDNIRAEGLDEKAEQHQELHLASE